MSLVVSTSSEPSGQEKALQLALEHGIITQEDYDRRLSEHRAEAAPPRVLVPTRLQGDKVVAKHKGLWRPTAGPFPSKELALAARTTVEAGKWKWNTDGCRKHLRCAAHEDCPVLMRVTETAASAAALGGYYLDILEVDHSKEEKLFQHARSKMTDAEKESVRRRMEEGKRPRDMYADDVLAAVVKDPSCHKDEGGVEGVLASPLTCRHMYCNISPLTYRRIADISYTYLTCILHMSQRIHPYLHRTRPITYLLHIGQKAAVYRPKSSIILQITSGP